MDVQLPSVYIETSVVSYLTARPSRDPVIHAHQQATSEWWTNCIPHVRPFVSEAVLAEASRGNPTMARKRVAALASFESLAISREVEQLAAFYLRVELVPESVLYDALHLAVATVHGIDYLLTWNCRHLASALVRRRIAELNQTRGLSTPILCTPEELMDV